jgi:pyruvate oxidase
MARYRCTVCNWVYDEEQEDKPFDSLPDTYTCPICGAPKSAFVPEGIVKDDGDITTTVADKIVEQMEAFGVRRVYGIPGDSNLPLIDAMRRSEKIDFILTRHEETAAFMASAHGKMTGEMGVCISIAGPGSTNLITGLVDAATDRSPVLALIGQVPEIYLGSEAFQEIDQVDLYKAFADYAQTVARPSQALKVMTMAVKYAYRKQGVSVLSMSTDVLAEKLSDIVYVPAMRLFKAEAVANDREIKKAAELINESAKVVVFAGWGARHSGELLLELAKRLKSPLATTSRAKGVIHESGEHSIGVLGSLGSMHAARAVQSCDLILIIGSGFRQANLVPPGIRYIQIDSDPTRIGKTFNVDVGLVGDAGLTLEKLMPYIEEKGKDVEWSSEIEMLKKEHMEELATEAADQSIPINPGYVIQALKRNVSDDALICVDVGDHTYWFFKKFICEGQRVFMSANIASMGFAFPASLAAKLEYPDKQVIALTGDGGFGMLMADFTTAVREDLAVKVVVFNDGKLKNIMKEELRSGYPEYGVSFPNPRFADFALGCGGDGYRVEDPGDLDAALESAFKSAKPAIVEVMVDPDKMASATKKVD